MVSSSGIQEEGNSAFGLYGDVYEDIYGFGVFGLGFRVWRYIGIMENNMVTTIMGYMGIIVHIMLGVYRDNEKENGSYY